MVVEDCIVYCLPGCLWMCCLSLFLKFVGCCCEALCDVEAAPRAINVAHERSTACPSKQMHAESPDRHINASNLNPGLTKGPHSCHQFLC
jgi:hypothetical protein